MTKWFLRAGTAVFCAVLAASVVHRVFAQTANCPCTIWPPSAVPANPAVTDGQPIETGVKFRSDVDGSVTAIRFYKGAQNTGTHVGHLWSAAGTMLAEATFTGESASGWQEVRLSPPVTITANTTYVASYHADSGFFALDAGFFAAAGVDAPPLHALQFGVAGPNGVYAYGPSTFPAGSSSSNYWIDVVLQTDLGPDVTPPTVASVAPAGGATGVVLSSPARAVFSEAIDPATINAATFELRDQAGSPLSGSVTYDASTRTATFAATAGLLPQSAYAAVIKSGPGGVRDLAGNALASDDVWSFTTGNPAPPADDGPGGPILVVSSSSNPFSRYYAEILRAEGLNEFIVSDISLVTPAIVGSYDLVLLGEIPLTASQVAMFSDYVSAGGNLVAMRPDRQLAGLLGLTSQSNTLSNAYLQIDTSSQPGAGIVSQTIQFHGAADRYTVSGATAVATLFSDATTSTANPAVTIAAAGVNGGHAAAFTYDLARSVVYTRQGNPAWSGQERDHDSTPLIRSDDLFFGAATGDVQPDWVDLDKVEIPQADEQQRLLANLLQYLNRARKPLPRFWYLPRGLKAAIVMTGDDHANGGTIGRFNQFKALSAPGCSVADWQCIRSTSYIFSETPGMDDATSLGFVNDGFEVALHVAAAAGNACGNATPSALAAFYASQIARFHADRPSVPAIQTNRTHCIPESDYSTQPKVELANGIRFDTNYYYYPGSWVKDRPGFFTGSGMPMRFADLDGTTIDVYQATTQMTDESDQTYPFTADTLLDRALGPLGYYGVFTANHHTDQPTENQSTTTVASAIARNVPVVSAKQMLDWLDGRNGSSFGAVSWNPGVLTFTIAAHPAANGLTAMLPARAKGGALLGLTRDGAPVSVGAPQVVKGVEYVFFAAASGGYVATYFVDVTPPAISAVAATPGLGNTAAITWTTDEPADSRVDFGTSPSALTSQAGSGALVTSHHVTLTGLSPFTTYSFRVTSADGAGNATTSAVASFVMPGAVFAATDTTAADFSAGTLDGQEYIAQTADGEIILSPAAGSEFPGSAIPADWSLSAWGGGGTATVSGGVLAVDGARAGTVATYPAGRSLEFVATFTGAPFQHIGFADTFEGAPFAMFSTVAGAGLFARTDSGSASAIATLSSAWLGSPHRFRIDWATTSVTYSIDGAIVATHAIAIGAPLRPAVSDFAVGADKVTVDWLRMSPYSPGGTFLSRVFDAGTAVNWGSLSWTAQLPPGTGVAFLARHGDTQAPDATWTAFAPIAASGGAIGGSSRYLQYRVDLTSSDPGLTPSVEQVTVGYSEIPLNQPPVAANDSFHASHAPLVLGVPGVLANDTDADGDALVATLIAGPAHGTVTLQNNGAFTYTPAAGFSGSDTFSYVANDGRSDSNVAVVSLAIDATSSTVTDTTTTDFGAGTLNDEVYVAQSADGEVILRPAAGSEFAGTTLPADWAAGEWDAEGVAAVSSGRLTVDGAWAGTVATYPAGRSLEFVATFTGATYQHVGFGETFDAAPWAIFSTAGGGGLFTRTAANGVSVDTPLSGALLGSPHRFRIDWTPAGVTYSVDGAVVASDAIAVDAALRPLVSDFTPGDGALTVDWIRMGPYASSGTFLSRIVDAGSSVSWGTLAWTAQVPAGAGVAFSARHGDTPAPDATWTAFAPVAVSGGAIGGGSRYLQYRVELASGDPASTPSVEQVSIGYSAFTPNHVPVATDDRFSGARDTPLVVVAPGVLANDTDVDGEPLIATLASGPAHGSIALQSNGAFTYTPAAGFAGTDSFSYRASDQTDNSNAAVVSIAIGATLFTVTDTTTTDFGAGAVNGGVYLAQSADGEVMLRPAAGSEFAGTALPAEWATGNWDEDGAAVVSGGALVVDGGWAGTIATYPVGRSLEFVATFTGAAYQHVGFGETFDGAPWAIFSTAAGGGLFARTASGGASVDTPLAGALLGSPHRFRIDWTPAGVTYTVDGSVVASDAIAVDADLRPLISDFTAGDGALTVDWIRMGPYASAGTFLSRIVDAGSSVNWDTLAWTAQVPAGTSAAFAVRHGDTPAPDATWTAFAPIAVSGGVIGGGSRYLQYRVELTTSGAQGSTPSIEQVSIGYSKFP